MTGNLNLETGQDSSKQRSSSEMAVEQGVAGPDFSRVQQILQEEFRNAVGSGNVTVATVGRVQ